MPHSTPAIAMPNQPPRPWSASSSRNGSITSAAMIHSAIPARAKGTIGGSSGLGGVLTATGVGTLVEEGKRKIEVDGVQKIAPTIAHGIPIMSIGFFLDPDQAVIWRGPMLGKALHQLMADVHWGALDYLVVDMPPGTGDVQITFSQQLKVSGALLVATPQEVALADVVRAKSMFDKVMIPILGIVENMSYFVCPHCAKEIDIFSKGGGERTAKQFDVPFLGSIELDPDIRKGGDTGQPVVLEGDQSPHARSLFKFARHVVERVGQVKSETGPVIEIQ